MDVKDVIHLWKPSPEAHRVRGREFEAAGYDLYRSSSGRSGAAVVPFSLQARS